MQLAVKMNSVLGRNVFLVGFPHSRDGKIGRSRHPLGIKPCRAEDEKNTGSGNAVVNEDILQRLRAAEAEAARLRDELAATKGQAQVDHRAVFHIDNYERYSNSFKVQFIIRLGNYVGTARGML
jgi:hypothetical protein